MSTSLVILAAGLPLILLLIIVQRHTPDTSPVRRATNPYRVGAYCTVIEDPLRPDMNWDGTVIATRGMYMTVRDNAAPYNTVDLEKSYVFPHGFTA